MAMTLIADNTSDTTDLTEVVFTSGIDNTYKLYIFKYYDINVATDGGQFMIQFNGDGESGYNEVLTTTNFGAQHPEDDGTTSLAYLASHDLAQGTTQQELSGQMSNDADATCSGELFLFNPSSTTYVTHFYSRCSNSDYSDPSARDWFVSGYVNSTAAITDIQFKTGGGNFDGTVKMYGVG